jgi:integrase
LKETEWALDRVIYQQGIQLLNMAPVIDLFAFRLNYEDKSFVAYQPDPEAQAVNAFTICSKPYLFYAFPPFSIIPLVLQKIREEHRVGCCSKMELKMLTYKTVMLLALLTGQRRQTLHALNISTMDLNREKCTFVITSLLKTSRPGKHLASIEVQSYKLDRKLCPVAHIEEYVKRTIDLQGNQHRLFISHQNPHKEVSGDTVSRWLKNT